MCGEVPVVSEGIFQATGTVAIEFVLNLSDLFRTGLDGPFSPYPPWPTSFFAK